MSLLYHGEKVKKKKLDSMNKVFTYSQTSIGLKQTAVQRTEALKTRPRINIIRESSSCM